MFGFENNNLKIKIHHNNIIIINNIKIKKVGRYIYFNIIILIYLLRYFILNMLYLQIVIKIK